MKSPWLKFYPIDWRADPRLRMCSLAARGLWIDLITYMHEGEPYGHLLIDGVVPTMHDVAALVGRPVGEVRKAFDELKAKGVCSENNTGVVFSRRMVRDNQKAETDKRNGKGGGNPNLRPPDKPPDYEGVNPPDKAQILEARGESQNEEDVALRAPSPGNGKYAFEAGVIRLIQKDFDQWKRAFEHLDLAAELLSLSEWAEQQPKWFHAVAGALAKRNREAKARLEAAKKGPDPASFWSSGIEGVT